MEKSCLTSICLGVKNLTAHHTALNIAEDLRSLLAMWNIDKKQVISATTDNGANIVAGIRLLFENNDNIHVPCFAHCINLVVSKALGCVRDIITIIDKVKAIVAYFKHSNVAQDDLRAEQRKDGKTDGTFLYLIQEVPTRWNSTFYCLERFLFLSGHVGKILLSPSHKKAPPMLSGDELSIIGDCLEILRPFELATKDISGEKYVSGSLVIPLIYCVSKSLRQNIASTEPSRSLKSELLKQMDNRLAPLEKNILLGAGTILDPRFKKFNFNSPLNAANAVSHIKLLIEENIKPQGVKPSNEKTKNLCAREHGIKSIWQVHDEAAETLRFSMDEDNKSGGLPTEFKLYLTQPLISRNSDPIRYWIDNKGAFPQTSRIALKLLTVLGASVPSERVVSLLNNVCTDHRSRLTPEHSNQLVFLGSLEERFWKF